MSTQTTPFFMLMHKGERKPKKHLGVLEIKPCQGRGLRVVQKIGKQDPYVSVEYGIRSQRTKADKNGGQKPRWEEVFKFDIFEGDTEVRVQCLDQNLRDSSLIGQRAIDFSPVLKSYQWDGWFGLTFQGIPAGDIYFEFTYHPEGGIPKHCNPPKPAVHRISLTPKEILCQMKESEDALPPLDNPSQNTEPQTESVKMSPQKEIPKSPVPAPSVGTVRIESNDSEPNFSGTLHSKLEHAYSYSSLSSPLHEKHPHHPRVDFMRSFIHRNSEPTIYPNGHFYSPPEVNLPAEKVFSTSPDKQSEYSSTRPEVIEENPQIRSLADRRKSRLIGPRRANSTPEVHNRDSPRNENTPPSKVQPPFEYLPSPMEHRYSVPYLPESPHFRGYPSPYESWGFSHIPSSPFPPPPPPLPAAEYPVNPAFMMSPHMHYEPGFFDENHFPYGAEAVPPTDCR